MYGVSAESMPIHPLGDSERHNILRLLVGNQRGERHGALAP